MARAKNVNVPLECLGDTIEKAKSRLLNPNNIIKWKRYGTPPVIVPLNYEPFHSFRYDIGVDLNSKITNTVSRTATEIAMMQGEMGLPITGVCQPHRSQILRKHVDSKIIEPKLLT